LYCCPVLNITLLDAISAQLAQLLKEERERQRLSLNAVAQKAGLARQTVSYVEQQIQNPTFDTLLRITSVLDVDLEKLVARARRRARRQQG
jgi:transcriptional regulator with XRE-family HTH domain